MKRLGYFLLTLLLLLGIVACDTTKTEPTKGTETEPKTSETQPEPSETPTPTPTPSYGEPLSVQEVLEKEDLEYVEFVGIVIGHDLGNRHIVIEDKNDPSYSIQLYKNPGYIKTRIGDEVFVTGYRTYDREVDRILPEDLEVLSRDNPSSYENPIVINGEDLFDWTNANRMNPDILFKVYRFENVEILSYTTGYTYIDDQYDEEGGRGLKIGIKNDSSVYPAENFIVGQRYSFTAILYGPSDDFYDDDRDGLVLRLSVMREEDVDVLVDGEDAVILFTGQRAFEVQEANLPIDFAGAFSITDPLDGAVVVTNEMISGEVDFTTEGVYPVTATYTNSVGYKTQRTINYYVTDIGLTVTEALNEERELDLIVNATVLGFGINDSGNKSGFVFHDPVTGKAIETWAPHQAGRLNNLEVGDNVLLYVGSLSVEKGLPRFMDVEVLDVISKGNAVAEPKLVEDIFEWANDLPNTPEDVFGRYRFTGTIVEVGGTYTYIVRDTNNKVQVAIHKESAVKFGFELGKTYDITAIIYGISDPFSALSSKSMVLRMGIMDLADVIEIEEIEPSEPATILSISEVIEAENNEAVEFTGIVTGYSLNGVNKQAMIISDPDNGNSIEMWINKSIPGLDELVVGDLVHMTGIRATEKGYPRVSAQVLVEVISHDNPLPEATHIEDLYVWAEDILDNYDYVLGRYSFTATVIEVGSYVYFSKSDGSKFILQVAVQQGNSFIKIDWIEGRTYNITASLVGVSDKVGDVATKNITTRMSIMDEADVELLELPIEPTDPSEPDQIMSVTDVIEAANNDPVEFEGIVLGYSMRNATEKQALVIGDLNNGNGVELWINGNKAGFHDLKVGDIVKVKGVRATEKGYPRVTGYELLELVSRDNELPEATLITTDLLDWALDVVDNYSYVLKRYTFTATIVEAGSSYVYFTRGDNEDNKILQVAIQQSNSFIKHTFTEGETYQITATLVGVSDGLASLATKSIVTRFSIMDEDHIVLIEEEPTEPSEPTQPTEPVDPTIGYMKVSEVIETANGELVEFVGIVLGYGIKKGTEIEKTALIIGDLDNGNAVELWINKSLAGFNDLVVGDVVRIKGTKALEKGYPRVTNYSLEEVFEGEYALPEAKQFDSLEELSDSILNNLNYSLGIYEFRGTVMSTGAYSHILIATAETGNILQVSIHNDTTAVKYNFVVGEEYIFRVTLIGISDPISKLDEKSISTRFSVMDIDDIEHLVVQ